MKVSSTIETLIKMGFLVGKKMSEVNILPFLRDIQRMIIICSLGLLKLIFYFLFIRFSFSHCLVKVFFLGFFMSTENNIEVKIQKP